MYIYYILYIIIYIYVIHIVFFRWVNRKDPSGKNVFSGGFLGLDNIGKQVYNIGYTFSLVSMVTVYIILYIHQDKY